MGDLIYLVQPKGFLQPWKGVTPDQILKTVGTGRPEDAEEREDVWHLDHPCFTC